MTPSQIVTYDVFVGVNDISRCPEHRLYLPSDPNSSPPGDENRVKTQKPQDKIPRRNPKKPKVVTSVPSQEQLFRRLTLAWDHRYRLSPDLGGCKEHGLSDLLIFLYRLTRRWPRRKESRPYLTLGFFGFRFLRAHQRASGASSGKRVTTPASATAAPSQRAAAERRCARSEQSSRACL